MCRLPSVATPATAVAVGVPYRVPLAGVVPIVLVPVPPVIATVTLVLAEFTVLPSESRTLIGIAGLKREPAAVGPGCTLKASRTAAGGAGPVKKSWTHRMPETSRKRGRMNPSPRRYAEGRGGRRQTPPGLARDGSGRQGPEGRP